MNWDFGEDSPFLLRTSLVVEVFTSGWAQPYLTCLGKKRVSPREAFYLSPCPENTVHNIMFEPKYGGLFETKPRSLAIFCIQYQDAVKDLKLHPENITKFQFPETPPWTLTPLNINLEIAHAKKSDTNPAFYQAAHKKV